MLVFEQLNLVYQFWNVPVQLINAKSDVEYISMLSTANHALFEFSSIFGNYFFHTLLLKCHSLLEIFDKHFFANKVTNCFFKLTILSRNFNHIVDQLSWGSNKFGWETFAKLSVWHILKNENIFYKFLFFQKFVAIGCSLFCINYQKS